MKLLTVRLACRNASRGSLSGGRVGAGNYAAHPFERRTIVYVPSLGVFVWLSQSSGPLLVNSGKSVSSSASVPRAHKSYPTY